MTRPPLTPFIRRTQATEPGTGLIAGILQARSPARHRNRRDNARQPLELPSYRTLQLQHSPPLSPAFGFTPGPRVADPLRPSVTPVDPPGQPAWL